MSSSVPRGHASRDHLSMKAALFREKGAPLELTEVERPAPGPGEVLVRVEAAGVCGTELHFLEGLLAPAKTPIILGHEVAGTVAETGEGVDEAFAPGDRVAVHYFHPCGRCRECRFGREHLCEAPLGFLAFVTDGGFAEYVRVPASALARIPDGLSFEEAAPLCCSATTALHALHVSGLRMGDTAVVYGCGGVGLALVQILRLAGVRPIAVSRTPAKLERAAELGTDVVVNAAEDDVASRVREATAGRGAEAVFELAGTRESMGQSLRSLARAGALVFIGYSFDRLDLSPLELVVPEARILTSVGNTYLELVEALELAARGKLTPVIHEVVPLEEANRVLDDLRAGRVVGRAVLRPA